ncbi:hypothetical protein [uncultured Apibacter sp.]|uniref:hypothetical protein n=1 Tax=uncultured Apibacter sp. TaxID=1778616 RepID=UPI0025F03B0B|nr:hypothetical protein [uncultured Apibacter sp.]
MAKKKRRIEIATEGSEAKRMLDYLVAEDLMSILLGENPSKAAEGHVKDFMIRHQRMLGLCDKDVQILEKLKDMGLDYENSKNILFRKWFNYSCS